MCMVSSYRYPQKWLDFQMKPPKKPVKLLSIIHRFELQFRDLPGLGNAMLCVKTET